MAFKLYIVTALIVASKRPAQYCNDPARTCTYRWLLLLQRQDGSFRVLNPLKKGEKLKKIVDAVKMHFFWWRLQILLFFVLRMRTRTMPRVYVLRGVGPHFDFVLLFCVNRSQAHWPCRLSTHRSPGDPWRKRLLLLSLKTRINVTGQYTPPSPKKTPRV